MANGRRMRAEDVMNPQIRADPERDVNLNQNPDLNLKKGANQSRNLKKKESRNQDRSQLKGAGPSQDLSPKKQGDLQEVMTLVVVLDQGRPLRGDDLAPGQLRDGHCRGRIALLIEEGSETTGWSFLYFFLLLFQLHLFRSQQHAQRNRDMRTQT